MLNGMEDMMHDMKLDGKPIQVTQEWTPYNPFTMPFKNNTWEFTPVTDWLKWYNKQMLGYPGLSIKNYLTMDAELLKNDLDNRLRSGDEFDFMQTLFQLVKHAGNPGAQLVYQMPVDFYREFVQNSLSLDEKIKEFFLEIKQGYVWAYTILDIAPVHKYTSPFSRGMTESQPNQNVVYLHNFKLMCMYFLQELLRRKAPCTTVELYKIYGIAQANYWNNVFGTVQSSDDQYPLEDVATYNHHAKDNPRWLSNCFENFIFDGRQVILQNHFAPINEILTEEIEW
jgi:hypothetical protein